MDETTYIGTELELFANAVHWKDYYGSLLKPYLKGRVLEVGSGMGETTSVLCNGTQETWVCLEPDARLAEKSDSKIKNKALPPCCQSIVGTIKDIPPKSTFDCIVYVDVIEHIENHAQELEMAVQHLSSNGFLIILAPAHDFLYSPFDKAIGHFRRYDKKKLSALIPLELSAKKLIYLDSCGFFASIGNKIFLKQSSPTKKQIHVWDNYMVNISKITDRLLFYSFGKSVLGVWQKPPKI